MLIYEPSHNNIEAKMSKMALAFKEGEAQDFESSMELDPFTLFINAIRAEQTRRKYQARLNTFFNYISISGKNLEEKCDIFVKNCHGNPKYAMNSLFKFIIHLKERMNRKEIVVSTIYNYLKPIKVFCDMNDIDVKWKKITLGLPKEKKYAEDRAPTIEEIEKLLEYPDRRIKVIILTMISCGMRLGAWNDLKYKHIQPIIRKDKEGNDNVVAAKITIYAGSDETYTSFITKEAYQAIEEWIEYRRKCVEQITGESWLVRNLWDVTTPSGGARGIVTVPKKLKDTGVKSLMERALRAQGIRTKLESGKKRYEFSTDHGFRKFFKTRCEIAGMRSLTVEYLLNHSTGITDSYYRPTEKDLLDDYLKVSDLLHIDKQVLLEKELNSYQQENQENTLVIKGKLQEKDEELRSLKMKFENDMNSFQEKMEKRMQELFLKIDVQKLK
jgi:integrase